MRREVWRDIMEADRIPDYIVYIMEGAQIASPLLTASIQYVINVLLTLPAIIFLDRWGRRPPLVIGAFMMMTWLFISGESLRPSYPFPLSIKTDEQAF